MHSFAPFAIMHTTAGIVKRIRFRPPAAPGQSITRPLPTPSLPLGDSSRSGAVFGTGRCTRAWAFRNPAANAQATGTRNSAVWNSRRLAVLGRFRFNPTTGSVSTTTWPLLARQIGFIIYVAQKSALVPPMGGWRNTIVHVQTQFGCRRKVHLLVPKSHLACVHHLGSLVS